MPDIGGVQEVVRFPDPAAEDGDDERADHHVADQGYVMQEENAMKKAIYIILAVAGAAAIFFTRRTRPRGRREM